MPSAPMIVSPATIPARAAGEASKTSTTGSPRRLPTTFVPTPENCCAAEVTKSWYSCGVR